MAPIKRDVIIIAGICSVILAMIFGLVADARLEIILIRTFLSLSASLILSFILVSAIEKFFHRDQEVPQNQKMKESEDFNKVNNDSKAK